MNDFDSIMIVHRLGEYRIYNKTRNCWISKWHSSIDSAYAIVDTYYPNSQLSIKNYLN